MKQTAVDFLIYHIRQDAFVHSKSTKEWNEVFQQSKAMEKEQIEDAELRGKEIIIIKHTEHEGGNK
jgi:hypothetical protein